MTCGFAAPAWLRDPRAHPAVLPFGYAALLVGTEAGLIENHHVLAGAILDAVLVLILVNSVQDPVSPRTTYPADGAMRALAVVALCRVIAIGLPLRDASTALDTLVVALLVAAAALGAARVVAVPIRTLMGWRAPRLQKQAILAGFLLGLAAYLVGAPRLWAAGAPAGRVLLALVSAVAAACTEELLFRGLLLVSLRRVAARAGLAASSAMFAATYLDTGSAALVIVIALAGVVFGSAVVRGGSLTGALGGHAALALGAGGLWPALFGASHTGLGHSPAATVALAVALAAIAALALGAGPARVVARTAIALAPPPPSSTVAPGRPETTQDSFPYGHAEAVLACVHRLDLPNLLDPMPGRERDLAIAAIVQLALSAGSASGSSVPVAMAPAAVGMPTGVEGGTPEEVAGALQWLADRQKQIEARLAAHHLSLDKGPPLYDIRVLGRSIYGLLSDSSALPVAVRLHVRPARDPAGIPAAADQLRASFGLRSLIVTCDPAAERAADLTQLWHTSGWIAAIDPARAGSLAWGERWLEVQRALAPGLSLRAGGAALRRGSSRALLTYFEATDPELRIVPPHGVEEGPSPGALTATMLSTYVAWHLREAWADLLLRDRPDADGFPLDSLASVFAALAERERTIRRRGSEVLPHRVFAATALQARALALITQHVHPGPWRE
ncbi:MAG: CPBP family intramembrane metalloprotease [Actinomycetota bacterium]|nr:CPBP family intramembrane metalloprotease [Actinomycetota bacterium]